MELEETCLSTVHALLLSFPVKTHLIPLIQLARKLSSSAKGSCKFVFTSIVSYQAAGDGSWGGEDDSERDGSDGQPAFTLRTIAVPDGLPSAHPRARMVDMIQACRNMKSPTLRFVPNLLQSSPPLSLVISDTFVPWAPELAASFHLPLFSFFTTNASAGCVMSEAPSLVARGIVPVQEGCENKFIMCPGAPPLLPIDLPASMQLQDVSHPQLQFTLNMFSRLEESAGLILNTCYELETEAIKTLEARCPVYTVGPLFLSTGKKQVPHQTVSDDLPRNDCLTWLDAQAPRSVLYVCFGTLADFSPDQMKELALGLENSQQPFLWVVLKKALNGTMSHSLPDGFLERVKDRCHITSWAPQLQVLEHEAVGGFFSHCGWNSILENMTLSGVPMLCWPDKAEQGVNARLIADVWKLGIPFKIGKNCKVSRGEVEQAVKTLMHGEEAEEMRKRGVELKKLVEKGVKQGGSSVTSLEALVTSMKKNMWNVGSDRDNFAA